MSRNAAKRVIIIGAGNSGLTLAGHLLERSGDAVQVTIIDKSSVPEKQSSLSRTTNTKTQADGRASAIRRSKRLKFVRGEALSVTITPRGVALNLADGTSHIGSIAVLATGGKRLQPTPGIHGVPWDEQALAGIRKDAPVLSYGSGLTMFDWVARTLEGGWRGPIYAVSPLGLMPKVNSSFAAMQLDRADVPFGTNPAYIFNWMRSLIAWAESRGKDWRSAVDGVRPHASEIWRHFPPNARRQFLRHMRGLWDAHAHRIEADAHERLTAAIASGQLRFMAGKIVSEKTTEFGAVVTVRKRGSDTLTNLDVAKIIQCRGNSQLSASRSSLYSDLLSKGLARSDPLGIGLDVTVDCAVLDINGNPSSRLFAVGPVTRATFWEIVAVPDVDAQSAKLSLRLTEHLVEEEERAWASTGPARR